MLLRKCKQGTSCPLTIWNGRKERWAMEGSKGSREERAAKELLCGGASTWTALSCLLLSALASFHGFHCTHGFWVYFCDTTLPYLFHEISLSLRLPINISILISQSHLNFIISQNTLLILSLLFLILLDNINHDFRNFSSRCLTLLLHSTRQTGY